MTVRVNPWTDDLLARVKVLWVHHSAGEIAAILGLEGFYVTRNAVVGKLHRAGLTSEHKAEVHPKARHDGQRRVSLRDQRGNGSLIQKLRRPMRISAQPFVCQEPPTEAIPLHISLQELTDETCRWPYGDGPYTFCGCQKISDGPYCYSHDIVSKPEPAQRKAWNRRAA